MKRALPPPPRRPAVSLPRALVASYVSDDASVGVIVEVNCETDFVANTDNFKAFCANVAKHIALAKPADVDELLSSEVCGRRKQDHHRPGERRDRCHRREDLHPPLRPLSRPRTALWKAYIHMGGKIGVLVETKNDNPATFSAPAFKAFYHDVALQIAAARPSYVRKDEVPSENLNKEKEILRAQALNEGKPEKIVDKMVEGRIEKYYKEVCLLEQPFVKDSDKSIKQVMAETAKEIGANIDIVRFERFERGEGIEKRQDNFAEEIAAQMAAKA